MKVLFCFLVFTLAVCNVLADFETCTEVANCSNIMKNRCDKMSESLKDTDGSQKLKLACKNGICMCNIEYAEQNTKLKYTCEIEQKEKQKDKDNEKEIEEKTASEP